MFESIYSRILNIVMDQYEKKKKNQEWKMSSLI